MPHYDLLIKPRFLIPIENAEHPQEYLEGFGLGITGGKIAALIPPQDLVHASADETITLPEHVIMPGFVNAHTHCATTLLRGLANDQPLMTWLQDAILPLEARFTSPEYASDGTKIAIAEMIQGGTTCFNDHYFFPHDVIAATQAAKMRAAIGFFIVDAPCNYGRGPQDYFEHFLNAIKHPAPDLIQYTLAPHSPYAVSDDVFKKIVALADQYDLNIHIHLHESKEEIERSLKQYGKRPIARLHDLGVLSPRLQAVHMIQINDEDWTVLEQTKPYIVTCPESNLKLASGFAPVPAFLDRGFNVALGTDGAASNNDLDMLSEARTLALLAKAVSGNAAAVSAHEALKIATLNGAKALGLDKKIGSLSVGKEADIIAINLDDPATCPMHHPINHVVYAAGRHQITHVWVRGEALMRDRQLLTCNIDEIKDIAKKWEKRIAAAHHPQTVL